MPVIRNIVSKFVRKSKIEISPKKVSLGRWSVDSCEKIRNMKIDSSNEDHCGVCKNGKENKEENQEEYIRYFLV